MNAAFRLFMIAFMVIAVWTPNGFSQALYSYIDENGVRNFTNIPPLDPKSPASEFKVPGIAPTAVSNRETENGPSRESRGIAAVDPIIEKYAGEYNLDPSLIRSMIAKESNFNSRAVSPKGAQGLMQLMPQTAARLGVRDAFDPEENIRGGMKHMRNLLNMFDNNLELSLAAYNAGENLVQRIGRVPNIRETRDYVRKITREYGDAHIQPQTGTGGASKMYRYVDREGVLHLSNIPPVMRINEGS